MEEQACEKLSYVYVPSRIRCMVSEVFYAFFMEVLYLYSVWKDKLIFQVVSELNIYQIGEKDTLGLEAGLLQTFSESWQ